MDRKKSSKKNGNWQMVGNNHFLNQTYLSMVNAVMGCSGPAPGFVSSLVARMSLIRKRSEGEQRDWEMFTKSKGSGTMTMLSLCWK